ncbi:uncharacterized protein LOC141805673 [Halichoeres trimaculatus]|uniref:uncharacterized protein LOC141805673 n=1 Tax=Halichoeres trimaculatus TaxID=147232 RepID=UPI003D9EFA22
MGQKQMRFTLPDEAACGSVDMSRDEAVLILLQHCQDMKRQETRLRLVSLLLLLSCVALFVFSQFQRTSGASGQTDQQTSAATPSRAYSQQDRECPAADPPTDTQNLRIYLTSNYKPNRIPPLTWNVLFDENSNYNTNTQAIVIPKDGTYLFYLRLTFRCLGQETGFGLLNVLLTKWNPAHPREEDLARALDSVQCRNGVYRTMSVIQLYDLIKGDQVSVSLKNGSELITHSSFGAFLT